MKFHNVNQRRVILNILKIFQKIAQRFALRENHYFHFHDLRSQ